MSDSILQALMQLFAIIASDESKLSERQAIIKSFLANELNKNAVNEYLVVFEKYFDAYHHTELNARKKKKKMAASSVKILRICTEIKEKLTLKQIYIVLIRLFEFVKLDKEAEAQNTEFVNTIAESFEIKTGTFNQIKSFVNENNPMNLNYQQVLILSGTESILPQKCKHQKIDGFMGNLAILNLKDADLFFIRYFGIHELLLNNSAIKRGKIYVLNTDSAIKGQFTKPIYFNNIYNIFNKEKEQNEILFEANSLYLRFKNGSVGLHNISFKETSGQLIGIMGTSGTGKTTLLNVLNGTNKPIHGEVLLNGINIHTNQKKLTGLIGHVSQDDYLIEELSVFENLYFNAKLNFSGHSEDFIVSKTEETLQLLWLLHVKDLKVGNALDKRISGGQRKRLNIALELIREPSVLFLDEPTSGLSSKDSEIIMDLLKNLSNRGKLIFNVIHQPSSDIFKMLDKLYVLDQGGYLIYNGDPIEAISYFKQQSGEPNFEENICNACGNVKPEHIFNIIESNVIDEYGNETQIRKITPSEWFQIYKEHHSGNENRYASLKPNLPVSTFKRPNWIQQFGVFVKRDVLAKFANKQYILVNLLEAPVLAFMLSYIIKYYDISTISGYQFGKNSNFSIYIFIAVIIAIFIGLSVSAQEIIKDKKILRRERFLHLSRSSYLSSKLFILFLLSTIQAFSFVIIGNYIMEIHNMILPYWLVLFSIWFFGNILGLLISDSFKTTVTIYVIIPFLIIPQLILSGVIVQFDKINPTISHPGNIPWYGEIITSRWAYESLAVYHFKYNDYEKELFKFDKIISKSNYKENFWISALKTKNHRCSVLLNMENMDELTQNLALLKNEITKELELNKSVDFKYLNYLQTNSYNETIYKETDKYLEQLKSHYNLLFNNATTLRNRKIIELKTAKGSDAQFVDWKMKYHNNGLERFVKNTQESEKIIEFENKLYQKADPIFKDPTSNFLKSHFYSSRKKLFGIFLDTYWVNIAVIWFMSISVYIVLYYQVLTKFINIFNRKMIKN